ncbi:hypothetical protein HMPREF0044_0119 [Gleimia coleocanis DSM 15436]|uniref:Uncharacterized protein n=1 Tax=Gleimia coleocanis DSM 15436 TaxID=525245 RepID=C0VY79_9ACTO|nr:hypothetical protein HMPREF0044_0119 [Gleimia coleocanis DSM 15436]
MKISNELLFFKFIMFAVTLVCTAPILLFVKHSLLTHTLLFALLWFTSVVYILEFLRAGKDEH